MYVTIALYLLWISLAVETVITFFPLVLNIIRFRLVPMTYIIVVSYALVMIFFGVINYKILNGRNWARLFIGTVFVFGFFSLVYSMFSGAFWRSPVLDTLKLCVDVLDGCALYLLFTRTANEWFRKHKGSG